MTIVEKAAYLKGLSQGLGIEPDSRDGKLWTALNELLSDMAHEIEDLQSSQLDFADTMDEFGDELSYLEELTCDLDDPEDYDEDDFEDYDEDEDEDDDPCTGDCDGCGHACELSADEWKASKGGPEYDGVLYDVNCPACGEEITFDEDTLDMGSIKCPKCGELLEFDLDSEDENEDEDK